MIVNELKPLLGDGWKEKFVHRDLWDPDGYGVASFDLGVEREKVLAMNLETEDIMEYFFDDKSDDEWLCLDRLAKLLNIVPKFSYFIRKDYYIKGHRGKTYKLPDKPHSGHSYPKTTVYCEVKVHRLIAFAFVPNPFPDKYDIVNHKDGNRSNTNKENLEWCDHAWNAQGKNQKDTISAIIYERVLDGKRFTRDELAREYDMPERSIKNSVGRAAKSGTFCRGSHWKIINLTEEDYLSRHPLQDDWYQHPTMPNVRANGCGILEIGGKLRIGCFDRGYYLVKIDGKSVLSHRILLECYIGRELKREEIVDHIKPVTDGDTNNSINNLRLSTFSENRRNPNTIKKFWKETKLFNLYGELIDVLSGGPELKEKYDINISRVVEDRYLVLSEKYLINPENVRYIYYRWENIDGKFICTAACSMFQHIYSNPDMAAYYRRKFLNTGMPAPDGCYYQQGDPQHMIYDPSNTSLEKKRPEIFWKDRNKHNNEEGNQ